MAYAASFDDNGGRRSGIDRRYYSYSDHIPERRKVSERRLLYDRRSGTDRRYGNGKVIDPGEKRLFEDRRRVRH